MCPVGLFVAIQIKNLKDFGSEWPNEGACVVRNRIHRNAHSTTVYTLLLDKSTV